MPLLNPRTAHRNGSASTNPIEKAERVAIEMLELLEAIKTNQEYEANIVELRREWDTGNASVGGALDLVIGPVPPGTLWHIQRISTYVAGGTNPTLALYLDNAGDPTNLIEVINGASLYSDGVAQEPFVRENRQIVARFAGTPANAFCAVMLQIKQVVRNPRNIERKRELSA